MNALDVDERGEVLGDAVTAERRRRQRLVRHTCRYWRHNSERFRYERIRERQVIALCETYLLHE